MTIEWRGFTRHREQAPRLRDQNGGHKFSLILINSVE
jgi:hypothetical protein